jgi:hypothetical protein
MKRFTTLASVLPLMASGVTGFTIGVAPTSK